MCKHWHILKNDDRISLFVGSYHKISYKSSTAFCDKLIRSHFLRNTVNSCDGLPHGTFKCGFSTYCKFVRATKTLTLPKDRHFVSRHFVNCATSAIVDLLLCPCGEFYIRKTLRLFWKRISEHIRHIDTNNLNSPLGR